MLTLFIKIYLLIALLLPFLFSCNQSKQDKTKPPIPVVVTHVLKKDVPVEIRTIGNVEAYNSVIIKSRIEGQLLVSNVKEGDEVKKGQLLFIIDPRPFEEAVRQAEANLLRDKAQLEYAKADLERYEELFREQLVSKQQFEKIRTNYETLRATIKADEAILKNARLNLNYCYIHSPIEGKIGALLVHPGSMIKANDTQITTINQIVPIYVRFSVPEQELLRIKRAMIQGNLKTLAIVKDYEKNYVAEGKLVFIDNTVDISTGTVKLKAEFSNKDKVLWPGQFVNVVLTIGLMRDSIVIPLKAVQTGQEGQYVYVINQENTAEIRQIVTGLRYDDSVVVEKGLNVGETIVIDGQFRLTPGAKVEIKNK